MRRVSLEKLKKDCYLARTIYDADGNVLLAQGVILKKHMINKLLKYGITEVFVEDETSKGIQISDPVSYNTRVEVKQKIKSALAKYNASGIFDYDEVQEIVSTILGDIFEEDDIVYNLAEIKKIDEYSFSHSVNVCVLSILIAMNKNWHLNELKLLGTAALLHDVGKIRVDSRIINKNSILTQEEFEIVKKHCVYGYEMLANISALDKTAALVALSHHERNDGSGYPFGLKGENIHSYSKIVSISDVYDALTTDTIYRKKVKARDVYKYITNSSGKLFDPEYIESFSECVAIYPGGSTIKLNTGHIAIVVKVRRKSVERPVVRIVTDRNGKKIEKTYDVDLLQEPEMEIVDSLEYIVN